jgi:hypothetical protein
VTEGRHTRPPLGAFDPWENAVPKLLVTALARAALVPAGRAHAATEPVGATCDYDSVTGPAQEGIANGQIQGGPLALPGGPGTLTCSIHVGNDTHAGAAATTVSGHGDAVVLFAYQVVFDSPAGVPVHLCAEYVPDDGSGPLYQATGGGWSTDPDVACPPAVTAGPDPVELLDATVCPVLLAVDARLGTPLAVLWEDCEPYRPIV